MIGVILVVSAVPIWLAILVSRQKGIPMEHLTRDPLAVLDAPVCIGFLSQLGIFFWAGAAFMAFLCEAIGVAY